MIGTPGAWPERCQQTERPPLADVLSLRILCHVHRLDLQLSFCPERWDLIARQGEKAEKVSDLFCRFFPGKQT